MKDNITKAIWWVLGLLFPPGQALWANTVIRRNNLHIKRMSKFSFNEFTNKWRKRICSQHPAASIIQSVYEHEAERRSVLSSKAQASLGIASLMIAVLSFLTPIVSSKSNLNTYFPVWGVMSVAFYMLSAIACAFHALRLERYVVVELDELTSAIDEANSEGKNDLETRVAADRATAVEYNRPITLTVANLVDAAFSSLRNSVVLLVAIPLLTLIWEAVSIHLKNIFS